MIGKLQRPRCPEQQRRIQWASECHFTVDGWRHAIVIPSPWQWKSIVFESRQALGRTPFFYNLRHTFRGVICSWLWMVDQV